MVTNTCVLFSHPLHNKTSIPHSHVSIHVSRKKEWFLFRDYHGIVVNNQTDNVVFPRAQSFQKALGSGIFFVTTSHRKVKELGKLIRDLIPFLHSDEEARKVFSPPPMVSYRSARKIKYYIVRSKLYLAERKVGCRRCGNSRCQVCKSINVTDEFTSLTTKRTYKITTVLIATINI